MKLVNQSAPVLRDQELLDLDIANVLLAVDGQFEKDSALSFVKRYFTADSSEIEERSAALSDMQSSASAEAFSDALEYLKSLPEEDGKYKRSINRVDEVLYLWRKTSIYIKALDAFTALMPENPSSSRIRDFKAFLTDLQNKSQCVRDALTEMDSLIALPKYFYVGINVKEDATPTEYGFIGTSTEEEPVNSLLSVNDPSSAANSLSPEFVYNSNLFGFHMDEYINQTLEKEWKNELPKAKKLLLNTPLACFEDFCAMVPDLSWLLVGLREVEAFSAKGYGMCRPSLGERGFFAENLRYPDLVLHRSGILGNTLSIHKGDSIIVTGANHSGKTSYLKTIGQSLLLAQLGFFVPADSFEFTPITRLFTLFSAGEDDSMDASRMGIEINKIQDICQNAKPGELILLNEPLTSTNPVEAVSICGDLCEGFIAKGITHILVTHLYDIYFLMKARLQNEGANHLHSLVTSSRFDKETASMVHEYTLTEKEPEGNSYARETAGAYGITVPAMLSCSKDIDLAEAYLSFGRKNSFYEVGAEQSEKGGMN